MGNIATHHRTKHKLKAKLGSLPPSTSPPSSLVTTDLATPKLKPKVTIVIPAPQQRALSSRSFGNHSLQNVWVRSRPRPPGVNISGSIRSIATVSGGEKTPDIRRRRTYSSRSNQPQSLSLFNKFGSQRKASQRSQKHEDRSLRYKSSETAWPISIVEALFLPEFPLKGEVDESAFQIEDRIARGAFGNVLKVRKKDTEVVYAMKVMSKSHIIMENAVQQCKDEVAIQCHCGHHAFIVECKYYWQSKKHLFIVMEYVAFGELLSLWRLHRILPEHVTRVYIAEIAIALDFLQNCGIIYRDLKMENILLDSEGHIQLIDFGLGKWVTLSGRASTICGTIQYMAPEILLMQPYSYSVDWWSLGIILYALLVGRYPVEGIREHTSMAQAVQAFDYSLPVSFTFDVRCLARKLLCKDPNLRLQSLKQLKWDPFFSSFEFDTAHLKLESPRKLIESWVKENAGNCEITECNAFEGFEYVSPAHVF